ncbi:MAG TPA: ATP-binding protein, partial [Usitatibacter sp.]|nr:ATP-binding protein [Usitatibacter sp.]
RLERMLESAERERFDLAAVVAGCVEGYRAAYPERAIEYTPPNAPIPLEGVPDAFAELLDKLVENANDFAPAGTPVRISLEAVPHHARLAVENDGPPLPEAATRLFDSMVSLRTADEPRGEAHLGLGLYIVRLVAQFHRGQVRAMNLPGGRGVRFEVTVLLP